MSDKPDECETCEGRGFVKDWLPETIDCPTCNGTGKREGGQ